MSARDSDAGFTLLELTLSLALGTALLMGFFVGYRTLLQSINLTAGDLRGPAEAAEAIDRMIQEIDQATSVNATTTNSYQLDFNIGSKEVRYRLVASNPTSPIASQDVYIERWDSVSLASTSFGPRRVIANFHPYANALLDLAGNPVAAYQSVPFIAYQPGAAQPQTDTILVNLVLQPSAEATASYVRALSTPRLIQN